MFSPFNIRSVGYDYDHEYIQLIKVQLKLVIFEQFLFVEDSARGVFLDDLMATLLISNIWQLPLNLARQANASQRWSTHWNYYS